MRNCLVFLKAGEILQKNKQKLFSPVLKHRKLFLDLHKTGSCFSSRGRVTEHFSGVRKNKFQG